ncbi:MAG: serine/threonine-protein kinase, partial [Blastocatellia bacterium]
CGDDSALRREVESLLVYQAAAGGAIAGAVAQAAGLLDDSDSRRARFTPGTTLNKRYRIIGLLGRGGMGEVYRADDLKLGHPVALKFLTEQLSKDKAMLARFHSEVAMAHRVTHPNVCRVHDIGEVTTSAGNLHFLTMEYVDGEDLSSLLRRIGRLPANKAVEIARQLCDGIAAAHEAGVLHRDLKPANVMIDGRGRVRITDFGLAGFAEQIRGAEVFAGTPAYMAPEQFAGKEVTTKSDLYSLGLVLYEVFTGKRVFEAGSLDELRRLHESSSPTNPSNWVKDIDPLVERVIMRCLEKDPGRRLASAKQVADALPGGDPLAAALAMGETPSPEMVAAAGQKMGMRPRYAVACLAAIILGLFLVAWMSSKVRLIAYLPLDLPPDALARKAREVSAQLGYTERPADAVWEFAYNADYLAYVEKNDPSYTRWQRLQPQAVIFNYRESPQYFQTFYSSMQRPRVVPPPTLSGMVEVTLDPQGRLLRFSAVPSQSDQVVAMTPDWPMLFRLAGLDPARFRPENSKWTPTTAFDISAAWTGTLPDQPNVPLRIEAAAWHGRPIHFEIIYPWTTTRQIEPFQLSATFDVYTRLMVLIALIGAVLIAWSNHRRGRGDWQGAFKLFCVMFVLLFVANGTAIHYVPTSRRLLNDVFQILPASLFTAAMAGLNYFALEPYVRRYWPNAIISWSRVMAGRWRDALVGRDVLIGLLGGIGVILLRQLTSYYTGRSVDLTPGNRNSPELLVLLGMREAGGAFVAVLFNALVQAVGVLFVLFLLRALLRRQWLAAGVYILLTLFGIPQISASPMVSVPLIALSIFIGVILAQRYGLIALIAGHFVLIGLRNFPFTTNFSAWYAGTGILALLAVLALAIWAFYTSLGGQKVFAGKLLEE